MILDQVNSSRSTIVANPDSTNGIHLNPACQLLVIGYGNTLRRDDGVGPSVAEAVAALQLPGVRTLACHQLTPELAETVAGSQAVVFVDAALNTPGDVELRALDLTAASGQTLAHAADPRSLVALAGQLFGHSPQAWALAIPVADLGFGDGLSAPARRGLGRAVEKIRKLANRRT